MQTHMWIGAFAAITAIVAGAAIGRFVGMSAAEGVYLTLLALSVIGWWIERRARRRGQR